MHVYEFLKMYFVFFSLYLLFILLGQSSTLSRSHSIASAGDKSLILSTVSSPNTSMHHPSRHVSDVSNERLLHELQMSKKQQVCTYSVPKKGLE